MLQIEKPNLAQSVLYLDLDKKLYYKFLYLPSVGGKYLLKESTLNSNLIFFALKADLFIRALHVFYVFAFELLLFSSTYLE